MRNKGLSKHSYFGLLLVGGWIWAADFAWAQFPGGGGGAANRRATGNYPTSTQVGGATVEYDPETRKLIVITDDVTAQHISQVVSNLNRPAPQVLIKVVFLEVTYRKGLDVGIEGGVRRNINDSTTGTAANAFGLSSLSSSATNSIANVFGQSVQSFGSVPPGAGLYQILGTDYQATLRAIAEAGKTEVLSRPSILTRNNQAAIITVGQRVPLVTSVSFQGLTGNPINTITYENVGIILQVTPFITGHGMVEMIVAPEISNLSDQTVTISAGVGAPVINTRSAETVVVTPDGQTVVIGGLMENSKRETESKIPVLGDIPGLGALFKRKVKSQVKTELLIFLTPYIVTEPSQLASLTATERSNAGAASKAFSERELNQFLDSLPAGEDPAPTKKKRK